MTFGKMTQVTSICFGSDTDKHMTLWGQQATKDMCKDQSFTPTLGGWKFHSVCDTGQGGTITTDGEAKGDFGSHYTVTMTSTTTGAQAPQANGTHQMTMEGAWKGACPAGMRPGDMKMPGGMTINVLDAQSGRGPGMSG